MGVSWQTFGRRDDYSGHIWLGLPHDKLVRLHDPTSIAHGSLTDTGDFSGIHFYFAAAEALHIVTTRRTPFQSLAAEYTPLNEEYRDDLETMEEGITRPT